MRATLRAVGMGGGGLPSRERAIRVAAAEGGSAARRREAATRPLIVDVGRVRRGTPAQRMSQPLQERRGCEVLGEGGARLTEELPCVRVEERHIESKISVLLL